MAVLVGHLPVGELRIVLEGERHTVLVEEVLHTVLGEEEHHIGPGEEEHRIGPGGLEFHIVLVEAALRTDPEVARHIGLVEAADTAQMEGRHTLAAEVAHRTVPGVRHTDLGVEVHHTGQEEAVGRSPAEVGSHLAVEGIVDFALELVGIVAVEADRILARGLGPDTAVGCSMTLQIMWVVTDGPERCRNCSLS